MATIPYALPQQQWPTISYFPQRFPENMYAHTADASLLVLSSCEQLCQRHFCALFFLLGFLGYFGACPFWIALDWIFWCQQLLFSGFCFFYFFLYLFVFGYPFGCRMFAWFSFIFSNRISISLAEWLSSFLEISFAIEINFCSESLYNSAVRTKTIINLCIFCFFDISYFVLCNLVGISVHFQSHNFIILRRVLTSVTLQPCATHKVRRHPRYTGHFNRHVRITRQMRYQLVRFLRNYEMHFSDLLNFLEQNKEHFVSLEQIYLAGAETPMRT